MAQKQISSALQKSGLSLKDRYEKKQEEELVVERRPVMTILTVLGILRTALCCILAAIGLLTMLHPGLRQVFDEPAPRILYGGWVAWINQKCAFRTHN